ncbi:hypothetical protein [Streptomyces sp. NPDC001269]
MVSPASRRWGRARLTSLLDRPSPTLHALHPALPARRRSRDVHRRPARLRSAPKYAHPDLDPVLNETYGVVIGHEQIIAILSKMTGCDRAARARALTRAPGVSAGCLRTVTGRGRGR